MVLFVVGVGGGVVVLVGVVVVVVLVGVFDGRSEMAGGRSDGKKKRKPSDDR